MTNEQGQPEAGHQDQPQPQHPPQAPQTPQAPQPPQGSPTTEPSQAPQPQWIQVPPHPYQATQQPRSGGKALAIISMALGLIALLTVIVAAGYFSALIAVVSGAVGLAAIVIGATALIKRAKPFGASITGVATGALAVLAVGALAVFGALSQISSSFSATQSTEVSPDVEGSDGWSPDTEQQTLLEWPANMASGGILFEGPGDPRPAEAAPLTPGATPLPSTVDRGRANDILIYVDYTCPHCSVFEQTNGEFLGELLEDGSATVEIVPLSFLDRATGDAYYSSRAAAAISCLADSQPDAAWAAHQMLLDPNLQPNGGPGMTNEQLVDALDVAANGLNAEASDCITNERFVSFAQSLNQWVFANPVPNADDSESRLQGTPSVFVNGVYFEGTLDSPDLFRAFYEEHAN